MMTKWLTHKSLMFLCGTGVVFTIIGYSIGWKPGEKGVEPAIFGISILIIWLILQIWHARSSS